MRDDNISKLHLNTKNKEMYSFNVSVTGQDRQKFLDELPDDEFRLKAIEFHDSMGYILKHFPILEIDPKLDESIRYTNQFIEDFRMPYPAFFINKSFKTEAGIICGIYVYDRLEIFKLLLEDLKEKNDEKEYNYIEYLKKNIIDEERLKEQPDYNIMHNIMIGCLILNNDNKVFGRKDSIYSLLNSSKIDISDELSASGLTKIELSKNELRSLVKDQLKYAIGIANLITANIDLDNPENLKKDIRIIPVNRDRQNRSKNRSVIRVFGKLRKDLEKFNDEIRRRGSNNVDAYIVRGHWRHFRSDRYKNKQGETIWVMPFVKGNGRELVSRVIGIKE